MKKSKASGDAEGHGYAWGKKITLTGYRHFQPAVLVTDMKPKQRAKAIADQLDKSDKRKWAALIEAGIQAPKTISSPAYQSSSKANPLR